MNVSPDSEALRHDRRPGDQRRIRDRLQKTLLRSGDRHVSTEFITLQVGNVKFEYG